MSKTSKGPNFGDRSEYMDAAPLTGYRGTTGKEDA